MKYEEFKKLVIDAAEKNGLKDYELYYSSAESVSVETFKHEINEFSSSTEGGVCFRTLLNGQMGYASTEDLSAEEAEAIVLRAVENAGVLETAEESFLGEGGGEYQKIEKETEELPPTEVLVKNALAGQDIAYAADPLVSDGTWTNLVNMSEKTAIFNSHGLDLSCENAATLLVCSALVSDGKEMNNSFEIKIGNVDETTLKETVEKAVRNAKAKLGAGVAPTGAYPVVFAPDAVAALLMTFSSAFSAEAAQKGLSLLAGKEGQTIASAKVCLTDDPFYSENPFPRPFDAEGMPAFRKEVIAGGELKTLLYNLKTAAVAGVKTTGNASKHGYAGSVGISPFTFVLQPGALSEEELLKKAGNGVYIDSLQGTHAGANPISGDFSLQSSGFMIENGEKAGAVKGFTVAGNFFELLKNVEELSDKLEFKAMGSTTAFAVPSILVSGLSVAGK